MAAAKKKAVAKKASPKKQALAADTKISYELRYQLARLTIAYNDVGFHLEYYLEGHPPSTRSDMNGRYHDLSDAIGHLREGLGLGSGWLVSEEYAILDKAGEND